MQSEAKQTHIDTYSSHVTRAYITQRVWLGLGEAIEWIVYRGTAISEQDFAKRDNEAMWSLIHVLSDTEPSVAERVVEGVSENDNSLEHKGIPHGIWSQTVPGEEYATDSFALLQGDDKSEFGGTLFSHARAWTFLRIRSSFILDHWKPGTLEIDPALQDATRINSPVGKSPRVSQAEVRLFLKSMLAQVPHDLAPLTQSEVVKICRIRFPDIPREMAVALFKDERPQTWSSKRGPRGSRDPNRKARLDEFIGKITSGELLN